MRKPDAKAFAQLRMVCRIILPFIILLGLFIIVNGDLSPGGGFQGGVVLSSAFLVVYFINENQPIPFSRIIRLEKGLFITLILAGVLYMLFFQSARNTFSKEVMQVFMEISMIFLNLLIGFKVALGLCGIMLIFIEEGNP